MEINEYLNSLKKVDINGIKEIIEKKLEVKGEYIVLGFRTIGDVVLFGELDMGGIQKPYIFITDNKDNACDDLYNTLQSNFKDIFKYGYEYDFSGDKDYYGYTDEKTGNDLWIYFPKITSKNSEWIAKRICGKEQNFSNGKQ